MKIYGQLLQVAIPVILSQSFQHGQTFVDRYFLAQINPLYAAIATSAGLFVNSINMIFVTILSFASVIMAKEYGANQIQECKKIAGHSMILSCFVYPLYLCFIPVMSVYFRLVQHKPEMIYMETRYAQILLLGGIFSFLKTCIDSYLISTDRSRTVLIVSAVGFLSNLALNIVFISADLFPEDSAYANVAFANVASLAVMTLLSIFLVVRRDFFSFSKFHRIRDLASYYFEIFFSEGIYTGLERFANTFCFVAFVHMFFSYGNEVATGLSIVLTWDGFALLPLYGIYTSVLSLFSRFIGSREPEKALQILKASLCFAVCVSVCISFAYYVFAKPLMEFFLFNEGHSRADSLHLGASLLRLTIYYMLSNTFILSLKAALRSVGMAKWCFRMSLLVHGSFVVLCYFMIFRFHRSPLETWWCYIFTVFLLATVFVWKFLHLMKASRLENAVCFESKSSAPRSI